MTSLGILLGRSGQPDAVDATVICLAADGDDILTSDPGDLRALAEAAGIRIDLIPRPSHPASPYPHGRRPEPAVGSTRRSGGISEV